MIINPRKECLYKCSETAQGRTGSRAPNTANNIPLALLPIPSTFDPNLFPGSVLPPLDIMSTTALPAHGPATNQLFLGNSLGVTGANNLGPSANTPVQNLQNLQQVQQGAPLNVHLSDNSNRFQAQREYE